jgi:hypothetical protein
MYTMIIVVLSEALNTPAIAVENSRTAVLVM